MTQLVVALTRAVTRRYFRTMRKSLVWASGVTLALGIVVSCGESESNPGPNAAGADAMGGDGSSGAGSAGKSGSSKGGSVSSDGGKQASAGQGPMTEGGVATQPAGGVGGDASTAGSATEGGAALGGAGAAAPGGAAGAGGDAAGAGGAGSQTPACDDGKAATEDVYSALYGCAHLTDEVPGGGDGWLYYDAGFYVDERTGAAWTPVAQGGSLDVDIAACAALQIGSLVDWRVPTIDEVRASFAGGCPATAPTGACPIHDPTHLSSAEVYTAACESCLGSGTSAYCPKNAPFCSWLKTSSPCTDCVGTKTWAYGPGNGNFTALNVTDGITMSCVIANLPGGVP